ncbi:MAG: alpha-L-fucosidase [Acidimicrobiaceae bacterium]|nr:alpha-L-fucosidase [Acidimicrobiaceae bacterium]
MAVNQAAPDYSSVGGFGAGDWIRFDGVSFAASPDILMVSVAAGSGDVGDRVEVRLDSVSGTKIADLAIADTGGNSVFSEQYAPVSAVSGVHDVYLVFPTATQANINWFVFGKNPDGEPDSGRVRRIQWWRDARFGQFIHWGAYSHLAGEYNGRHSGEWIMGSLGIPVSAYERDAAVPFNPTSFDAETWARTAAEAGQKYVVITAKHHEGFSVYDTNVRGFETKSAAISPARDYDIKDVGSFGRDPIAELAAAVRAQGLRFGIYYSIWDWHFPDTAAGYLPAMNEQLRELVEKYDPDLLWFDGEWTAPWTRARGEALYKFLRVLKPDLIINDRVVKKQFSAHGDGDYGTTAEKGGFGQELDWERAQTMNDNWGFVARDTAWKSTGSLLEDLVDAVAGNGNYLLNIGPDGTGTIPAASVTRLKEIGDWLTVHGPAIYGTDKPNPLSLKIPSWGWYTTKGDKVYAIVKTWPANGRLTLEKLDTTVTKAALLNSPGKAYKIETSGREVIVSGLPTTAPDPHLSVLELSISGEVGGRHSLAYNRPVTVSDSSSEQHNGAKAVDGSSSTCWATAPGVTTATLTVDLDGPQTFNRVIISEATGRHHVTGHRVQYWDGSAWATLHTGTTIGAQESISFAAVTAGKVRLSITGASSSVHISEFQVWKDVLGVEASFAAAAYSADEGDSVSVTVTLSEDPGGTLTVPITATGQGGAADGDYTVPSSVTFDSGETSKSFTFAAADDSYDDDGESVRLGFGPSLPAGVVTGTPATTVVSINDDDQPPPDPDPVVSVTAGPGVTEGGSATFTVTADPSPKTPLAVSLTVSQQGDYAAAGAIGAKTVTVPTSGTKSYTVATTGDDTDEAHGSVTVTVKAVDGYAVSESQGAATVAVSDDDDPPPVPTPQTCVTADTALLAQVEAKTRDPWNGARPDLVETFTRSYHTMQGADDYTVADVKARPDRQEPNWQGAGPNALWQKIYAELDSLEACRATPGTPTPVPPPPTMPEVAVTAGAAVTEGAAAAFTLSASPAPSAPLTVTLTVSQSGDWGVSTGMKTVVIPTTGTKPYSVATAGDNADEPDGSVTVTLNAASGYIVSSSQGTASVSVSDDDPPPPPDPDPEISVTAGAGVVEGSPASFTVTATPAPASPLTVSVAVSQSGDWGAATGTRTVTVGASGTASLSVATAGDSTDEPDGSITLTVGAGSGYAVSGTDHSASSAVADDDATTVTLAAAGGGSIAEDGGTREITVTLGRALAAGETATVPLDVSGATVGDHHTLVLKAGQGLNSGVALLAAAPHSAQNPAVVFAAGAHQATLVLTAVPDDDTAQRTVRIAYGAGQRAPAAVGLSGGVTAAGGPVDTAIENDDQPPPPDEPEPDPPAGPALSVRDVTVGEGGRFVRVMVYISEVPDSTVTVWLSARDGTAEAGKDYRPYPRRLLTFAARSRLPYHWVYLPILDDTAAEGDETFEVVLTDAHGAAIAQPTATITITDND